MSAPVGIAVSNIADGRVLDVNDEVVHLFGYSREEIIGRTTFELGLWAVLNDRDVLIALSKANGEVYGKEVSFRKKGGDIVPVRFSAHTVQLHEETMVLSAFVDLTDRKRAEAGLLESEQKYRELVDGVRDVIYAASPDGLVTALNDAFEKVTGWTREDWIGKPFIGLIHPEDSAKAVNLFEAVLLDTPRPEISQLRVRTKDGKSVIGEFHTSTQRKDGKVVGMFGIVRDVTERLSLEAQLHQAQKMEAVGRLAGGVAHDFNNVLTAILGYCELVLADLDPHDTRREDISEIQKAGNRAAGLTRQLLAFSRKQIIEPTQLDLNAIAADIRAMLEDATHRGRRGGRVAPPSRAGLGEGYDHGQVEQVILNLAVNARDAMPHGGKLMIATANVDLDEDYAAAHPGVTVGAYVALTVSDTGTGMTPDVQARLFEPFFTTKSVGKGTGLGLATVHGIVARGGGSVGVYSELGKGTSFTVYFPRMDAVEATVEAPRPVARPRSGGETILVVEDVSALRELATRLLERQGYKVLVAASAEDALRVFDANASIDVLLTDVVMPGASGPELTSQLIKQRPSLKVIYMSGYTEETIVQHGILNPGIAFLNKPFSSDGLGRKIRDVLDANPSV